MAGGVGGDQINKTICFKHWNENRRIYRLNVPI